MRRPGYLLAVVGCLAGAWAGARSSAGEPKYPGYFPSFPAPAPATGIAPDGAPGTWLGGDGPFCCPLDATRSFWSFCDVGTGQAGAKDRVGWTGVGNTIAIAVCKDGKFTPYHYFRGSPSRPVAYFPDPENPENDLKGSRFWLRKALLHKGRLYIFAHQVADPGSVVYNTKLIRVYNPFDSPTRWKYDLLTIGVHAVPKVGQAPPPPPPIHFGNEAFIDAESNYLYTYGVIVNHKSPSVYFSTFKVTALRIPLDRVENATPFADLGRHAEYMTAKFNEWKPGLLDPADVYDVGIPAVIGYTVRYNATLKAWQVVFSDDRAIAENIWMQRKPDDPGPWATFLMTGPSAYGPWTRPVAIARYPEMDPTRAGQPDRPYNPDDYGYAVGEQSAFEPSDGVIVFTYAVGSLGQHRDKKNTRLDHDLKVYNSYGWVAPHPDFGPIRDRKQP